MVVSFSSIKGGTGKTSICIHVANYCAAAGYRVLVIDFDIQNSLSFYYLDELSVTDRKNLALALNSRDLIEQYSTFEQLRHRHSGLLLFPDEPQNHRGKHPSSNDFRSQAGLRLHPH